MRLAFVDLYFSWPPHGGADVDLYHVIRGIQGLGHDVHLFVTSVEESWERGKVDPSEMPFPTTRIDLQSREINRTVLPARIRKAVDAWKPEGVFLGDGFFLKPYVTKALSHYPLVSRYYAYELTCPRDLRLFKDGTPCPMNYLRTPDVCRPCALAAIGEDIRRWRFLCWSEEYLAAHAFMPGFHRCVLASLRDYRAVIVYNLLQKQQLDGFHGDVCIAPGGVDTSKFMVVPPRPKGTSERKVILMSGRTEDPAKGLGVLLAAGERLARTRKDFEIWATHTDCSLNNDWFKAVGWHDFAGMARLYADADICVFPSVWPEPFGLVAVEAMASGRAVCASRIGGLEGIVEDGVTGFLFTPGDDAELASCLARLLDDEALRRRMGEAGRTRVEREYDWDRLVAKHYPPILEALVR